MRSHWGGVWGERYLTIPSNKPSNQQFHRMYAKVFTDFAVRVLGFWTWLQIFL